MVSLPGLPALPAAQFHRSLEYAGELLVRTMSGLLSANCCRIMTVTPYTFCLIWRPHARTKRRSCRSSRLYGPHALFRLRRKGRRTPYGAGLGTARVTRMTSARDGSP
jgi:hypothetical protein